MDCWFTKHDVRSKRKRRVSCFPFHRETKSKTQDVFPQSRFLILHQPYLLLWRNTHKLRVFLQAKSVTLKIHGNLHWRVHVEIYTRVFCLEICHVARNLHTCKCCNARGLYWNWKCCPLPLHSHNNCCEPSSQEWKFNKISH